MAGKQFKLNKSSSIDVDDSKFKYTKGESNYEQLGAKWLLQKAQSTNNQYQLWLIIVTLITAFVRFYKLWYPKEVVFDEVHFGKFASYYLERSYFFDVHPPFAKMAIAFIGWLCSYDGSFKFNEIGDSYETHPAPYLAYRAYNAILGTLTIPLLFNTLKEMNFKATTCAMGALLVAIDNAHVIDSRLILLDAMLLISIAATFYCYTRFYKEQLKKPFTKQWFLWLHLTGFSLSLVISTKYVGVMTYASIGVAVAINLWQLLDIRSKLTLKQFYKHFVTRLTALVLIPFTIYLFWFWVHFTILNTSGQGDAFMSAEFQETLADSEATMNSKGVNYYDIITIKSSDTKAYLHSHLANYPLRYEDGRVSTEGQQVTGYHTEDPNNEWEILPLLEQPKSSSDALLLGDHFRLRHIATNSFLLTHDVASPMYPTNEEVTTVNPELANGENYKETIFEFQPYAKGDVGHAVKTELTSFRIFHVDTEVALWTHNDEFLPEWGFNQQEVNGNKNLLDEGNKWFVDKIVDLSAARNEYIPKVVKKLPFFTKWFELQNLMFEHNNKLTSEHPAASQPQSWPGSLKGVSFWTKDAEKKQIYFIGNIIGFWFEIITICVYVGIIATDLITRQRGYFALNKISREKLYGPLAYLLCGWACHYFPFFLMGRQKFLHHYLPAHLIAAMFTAGVWEVIFSDCKSISSEKDEDVPGVPFEATPKIYTFFLNLFFIVVAMGLISFFIFFAPLTYGDVGLNPKEIALRQWFDIVLSFSK
ncbi:dolichyl-phosphate-mannose--protein mannosyltransferase 4 [Monosporozyma unispora]|nr:Dolichyl-phosphate-mannose--protein mannosyltransferase 4 [Kazachstania unispora]